MKIIYKLFIAIAFLMIVFSHNTVQYAEGSKITDILNGFSKADGALEES